MASLGWEYYSMIIGVLHIICAHAGRQENVSDAFAMEAHAMSYAVSLADDLGSTRVDFETDSQLSLDALDMYKVDSLAYAAVIEDTKY